MTMHIEDLLAVLAGKATSGEWAVSEDMSGSILGGAIDACVLDARGFPVAKIPVSPVLPNWDEVYPKMRHWAEGAEDGCTQIERAPEEVAATATLIASFHPQRALALLAVVRTARLIDAKQRKVEAGEATDETFFWGASMVELRAALAQLDALDAPRKAEG